MSTLAPRRRPAALLALAVVVAALIAGCATDPETDGETPTPSETTSAATAAQTGTCTDGFMLVDTNTGDGDSPVPVSDVDCDLVSIVGSGGAVELGTVGTLVVEGTDVAVTVAEVTTVRLAGDRNTVTHGGDAPTTEDAGVGNSVVPAA